MTLLLSLLIIASCQTSDSSLSLFATDWELKEIAGSTLKTPNLNEIPYLSFSEHDKSISGHTGCNRLAGSFHYSPAGELVFAQAAATKIFCDNVSDEQALLQNLSNVKSFEIQDHDLLLYDAEKAVILKFSSKKDL